MGGTLDDLWDVEWESNPWYEEIGTMARKKNKKKTKMPKYPRGY